MVITKHCQHFSLFLRASRASRARKRDKREHDAIFPCRKIIERKKKAGFGPCRREKKIRDGSQFQEKR